MSRLARILAASSLLALVGLTSCISPDEHRRVLAANDALRNQIEDLDKQYADQDAVIADLRERNASLGSRVLDADFLKEQKAELERLLREFRKGGGASIEGVTVVQTSEGLAFQVRGEVLFPSGVADLKASGKTTLSKILPHLRGHRIRVSGHTDSDPIRRSRWKTNLNLSVARAVNVAHYLIQEGLPQAQLGVAGHGANRPVRKGTGKADKAANRRVEILLVNRSAGGGGSAPAKR